MDIIYISSLGYAILSYLITYVIGHVLLSFIKLPERFPFLKEFSKLCIGFFSIITVYSIIKTTGITINLGVVLLFIVFIFWLKKNNYLNPFQKVFENIFSGKNLPYVALQLLILVVIFTFLFFKMKDVTGNTYQVYGDFYNYAKYIQHLNKTGIEGYYPDWYSGVIPSRSLYHFGELWYSAFYSALLRQTPFNTFYFQLFPHCLAIYFLGACALIEVFIQPVNKRIYIAAILILFICGLSFYIPRTTIFTRYDWWDNSLLFQPKYFFPAIFIFYGFIFTRFSKNFPLLIIAMATILVCTVVAPSVLITAGLYVLFLFISGKIDLKILVKYSMALFFTAFFIGSYTLWIHHINDVNSIVKSTTFIPNVPFSMFSYIKTAFNCFSGQIIKSLISLFPFIALFYFVMYGRINQNDGLRNSILFFLVLHLASIVSYAIFFNSVDAVQLWTNIYVPLSAIVCFVMLVYILNEGSIIVRILLLLLVVLSFKQSRVLARDIKINEAYNTRIKNQYDGGTAVFFKGKDDFSSVFSKNINVYAPSAFLIMYYKEYNPVCLSVFEIPKSDELIYRKTEEEIIQHSTFYLFVEEQKLHQQFISVEQSQKEFVKKYSVRFAFTYPHATLPDFIKPSITSSVYDSIEGITFYTLRSN